MQPSDFDYYHLTAGKKRLWATQMGSAFWISSVVGGHHNLMLRRQQPGEHPIIDPAQESLLFRRIVAMGRFIRPVDMQQPCGQRSAARRAASVLTSRSVSTSPVAPFTGKSSMCSSRAIPFTNSLPQITALFWGNGGSAAGTDCPHRSIHRSFVSSLSKAWYSSPIHPACSSCPAVAGHRAGRGFRPPAPLHSLGDVPADPLPPTGAVRSAVFPVGSRRRYPHTAPNPWTPDGHIAPPESGDPSCRQSRIISCASLSPFFH